VVSPGNPLKASGTATSLEARVAVAKEVARHPKIVVTAFEAGLDSPYTVNTVSFLMRRFPSVRFVWLMGADNLAALHRWQRWEELVALAPIAALDRPGYRLKALAGRAAQRFASARVDESDARGLAQLEPPAWTLLTIPLSPISSTALRERGKRAGKQKQEKGPGKKAEKQRKREAKAEEKAAKKAAKQADAKAKKRKGKGKPD
jgi:nicotinate-nucleotide adenylyltransferase